MLKRFPTQTFIADLACAGQGKHAENHSQSFANFQFCLFCTKLRFWKGLSECYFRCINLRHFDWKSKSSAWIALALHTLSFILPQKCLLWNVQINIMLQIYDYRFDSSISCVRFILRLKSPCDTTHSSHSFIKVIRLAQSPIRSIVY